MIGNPRGMDAERELQGCIYAFSNHKAVLASQLILLFKERLNHEKD
jgi:hypothetical protein